MPTGKGPGSSEELMILAKLARLELTPEEVESLRGDLESILKYADNLPPAEMIPEPTAEPLLGFERQDETGETLDRDKVLAQASGSQKTFFRVPPTVER